MQQLVQTFAKTTFIIIYFLLYSKQSTNAVSLMRFLRPHWYDRTPLSNVSTLGSVSNAMRFRWKRWAFLIVSVRTIGENALVRRGPKFCRFFELTIRLFDPALLHKKVVHLSSLVHVNTDKSASLCESQWSLFLVFLDQYWFVVLIVMRQQSQTTAQLFEEKQREKDKINKQKSTHKF